MRLFKRKPILCAFCGEELGDDYIERSKEKFCNKEHAKMYEDRRRRERRKLKSMAREKKGTKRSCCH